MDFIERLDEPQRTEIRRVHDLITTVAPDLEVEAGEKIIGYGPYHYRYASGREGDAHLIGLAPRKGSISLYVSCTKDGAYLAESYVDRLPKASIGKSCVRFKRTSDLDLAILRELIAEAARLGPPYVATP
ncbi:DUF1801 domain-containing protein [Solirubrobacter ginsenosidimutans]|uniref:DUF1801 domain-containing protein n=1 Tax=Solirubrobacter ginsenosidimutans TaxID=490573 RepID=A0A9X3MRB5_9ACTN|nr:DUF1801 domain-containing protein [Solirubrobacter ginsenosidimutans]MDA0160481.1 DUF1801 domain-containing protein [Solirubrobacter ginsenosidimutans]